MPLPKNVNKAAHPGFETQRRHHLKSETGISVGKKWTCVQQIFFKKWTSVEVAQNRCVL